MNVLHLDGTGPPQTMRTAKLLQRKAFILVPADSPDAKAQLAREEEVDNPPAFEPNTYYGYSIFLSRNEV